VFRFGWARYIQPSARIRDPLGDFVEQYTGYSTTSFVLATSNGQPRSTLSNPFPTVTGTTFNPVLLPTEQTLGRYTNIGNPVNLDKYDQKPPINDKITVAYQRELWNKMVFTADYFINIGRRLPVTIDINSPNINYLYSVPQATWNISVANPFLNYLTPAQFPGALRNAATINGRELLRPFPHYGAINQLATDLRKSEISSFKLQVQQPVSKGLIFTAAYAYNDERTTEAFDEIAAYNRQFTWRRGDAARHRFTNVVTWDIPIGKGRALFGNAPKIVDYIFGGWRLTDTTRYYSGRLLQFGGNLIVNGNPKLAKPTRDQWFDTSVFSAIATATFLTPRSNAWWYNGLVGPATFQTDATVSKSFKIRESIKLETRVEVYNVLNNINWENPTTTYCAPGPNCNFGKVTAKRNAYVGREVQYGLRLTF
jgi:hypothetical protein